MEKELPRVAYVTNMGQKMALPWTNTCFRAISAFSASKMFIVISYGFHLWHPRDSCISLICGYFLLSPDIEGSYHIVNITSGMLFGVMSGPNSSTLSLLSPPKVCQLDNALCLTLKLLWFLIKDLRSLCQSKISTSVYFNAKTWAWKLCTQFLFSSLSRCMLYNHSTLEKNDYNKLEKYIFTSTNSWLNIP